MNDFLVDIMNVLTFYHFRIQRVVKSIPSSLCSLDVRKH